MSRRAGLPAGHGIGFTLVEVMVAMTILATGLLFISGMVPTAYTNIAGGAVDTRALGFAQERLDQLRIEPWTSAALTAGAHSDAAPASGYTRSYTVEDSMPMSDVKRITITVVGPRARQVVLRTLITH